MSPFLTIEEAADLARVSAKRIRNLMTDGILREGIHFTRPHGLAPRFRRAAVMAWLDTPADRPNEAIPMASAERRNGVALAAVRV